MIRAFIAAEMPSTIDLRALLDRLRGSNARISIPKSEGIHITLKFLGDIEEASVPLILGRIKESLSEFKPFDVVVERTGAFPGMTKPRVLWVGLEDQGMLARIGKSIDDNLAMMSIPRENRPFTPHVTVARVKSLDGIERAVAIMKEFESTRFGSFRVKDIRLKKSTLTPTGSIYEDLGVIGLSMDATSDR